MLTTNLFGGIESWKTAAGTQILVPQRETDGAGIAGGILPTLPLYGSLAEELHGIGVFMPENGIAQFLNAYQVEHEWDLRGQAPMSAHWLTPLQMEGFPWSYIGLVRNSYNPVTETLDLQAYVTRRNDCGAGWVMPVSVGFIITLAASGKNTAVWCDDTVYRVRTDRRRYRKRSHPHQGGFVSVISEESQLSVTLSLGFDQVDVWSHDNRSQVCLGISAGKRSPIRLHKGETVGGTLRLQYRQRN
jgi:hypothetical protein